MLELDRLETACGGVPACSGGRDERPPSRVPKLVEAPISDTYIIVPRSRTFSRNIRAAGLALRIAPAIERFLDADAAHSRDPHARMLHILGNDHTRFTYPFGGLDVRLSGVEEAHVVRGILV